MTDVPNPLAGFRDVAHLREAWGIQASDAKRLRQENADLKRKGRIFNAMVPVVGSAVAYSKCAAEFDGDLAPCGEYLNALRTRVDRYLAEMATINVPDGSGAVTCNAEPGV